MIARDIIITIMFVICIGCVIYIAYQNHVRFKRLERASEKMSQDCFITDCKVIDDGLWIPRKVLEERKRMLWEKVRDTRDTVPDVSHAWNGRFFEIANMLALVEKESN